MSRNNHPIATGTAPQYGKHNMSHRHLTTLDVGRIQVMAIQECVTNDQISCNLKQVVTTAPNQSPLQGKFKMHTAAFYVRNRVVMKDWNKYRTGMQVINIPHFDLEQIPNYFGQSYPNANDRIAHVTSFGLDIDTTYFTKDTSASSDRGRSMRASLIPFRCYERVWWDWFRNSQVVPDSQESSYLFSDNNNENVTRYFIPHYANWQKDFMSNFLRTPNGDRTTTQSSLTSSNLEQAGARLVPNAQNGLNPLDTQSAFPKSSPQSNDAYFNIGEAGATATGSPTVNTLRYALGLQAVIEKMSALGGRLKDRLKGMFGSSVSYEVLGMSELLGYNEYDVNFDNDAANVSNADGEQDVNAFGTTDPYRGTIKGQMTGKSTMTENGLSNVNYHCTEDGFFMILSWLTPDAMLSQGLAPMWFRGIDGVAPSRFDFLTDEFVGKGFDPIFAVELVNVPHSIGSALGTYDPFKAVGFNAKYHNYTYHHDVISGDFRNPNTRASMSNWVVERDVLKEQKIKALDGSLVSGKTGNDVDNAVVFNNFQGVNEYTREAYDANFMYTGADIDHFVVQNKCELIMTRRLPSAPRVDLLTQNPTTTEIGGTRL